MGVTKRAPRRLRTEIGTGEPVRYRTKVRVRMQLPWREWQNWNDRYNGGPELVVRQSTIEVVAAQGMMLDPRHVVFRAADASMWKEHVGFSGLPVGRRDSIVLAADSNVGRVWLALTAGQMNEAWDALRTVGVLVLGRPPSRLWYRRVAGGRLPLPGRETP